ncbi:hypothetical protein YB2330_005981 [Saitoella coloradoensis]
MAETNGIGLKAPSQQVKRRACVICRRRKLRCDGIRPLCGNCSRLGHDCGYDETRRKSGPRQGYVKGLENRLAQVEKLLESAQDLRIQDPPQQSEHGQSQHQHQQHLQFSGMVPQPQSMPPMPQQREITNIIPGMIPIGPPTNAMNTATVASGVSNSLDMTTPGQWQPIDGTYKPNNIFNASDPSNNRFQLPQPTIAQPSTPAISQPQIPNLQSFESMSSEEADAQFDELWELMRMNPREEEDLPRSNLIDVLNRQFCDTMWHAMPILHRGRFLSRQLLPPGARPVLALRFACWALAAAGHEDVRLNALADGYYSRAKLEIHKLETGRESKSICDLGVIQAYTYLAVYEIHHAYWPSAWMSVGAAARCALMMGLHRIDSGEPLTGKAQKTQKKWGIREAEDRSELEERRRTFWGVFAQDRKVSVGTGWPCALHESDVTTNLPVSEAEWERDDVGEESEGEPLFPLHVTSMNQKTSPWGALLRASALLGKISEHINRESRSQCMPYSERHKALDNLIQNTLSSLPIHLRVLNGSVDPRVLCLNLGFLTCVIHLHAAVLETTSSCAVTLNREGSMSRCYSASMEMANLLRLTKDMPISFNYMITNRGFSLYSGGRVLVLLLNASNEAGNKIVPGMGMRGEMRDALQVILENLGKEAAYCSMSGMYVAQLQAELVSGSRPEGGWCGDKVVVEPQDVAGLGCPSAQPSTPPGFHHGSTTNSDESMPQMSDGSSSYIHSADPSPLQQPESSFLPDHNDSNDPAVGVGRRRSSAWSADQEWEYVAQMNNNHNTAAMGMNMGMSTEMVMQMEQFQMQQMMQASAGQGRPGPQPVQGAMKNGMGDPLMAMGGEPGEVQMLDEIQQLYY